MTYLTSEWFDQKEENGEFKEKNFKYPLPSHRLKLNSLHTSCVAEPTPGTVVSTIVLSYVYADVDVFSKMPNCLVHGFRKQEASIAHRLR